MVEVGYNKSMGASCVLAGTLSEQYSADGTHWKTLTSQHETTGTSADLQQPLLSGTYWYRGFFATDDGTYNGGSDAVQFTTFFGGLYWVGDGGVEEANLDGTDPHPVVSAQAVHSDASAVAAGSAHLYYADEYASPGGATIGEANLDGTNLQTIVYGQSWPVDLALNSSNLYWADGVSGTIDEANLDGTDPHPIVPGQSEPTGVAVDSSHLYWATISGGIGTIDEANLDGTDAHPIVSSQNGGGINGVAVDSSHLYWTDGVSGTIDEANLDGTDPHPIVSGQSDPGVVAVDSSHLYWATFSGGIGTIHEANLDGTDAHPIVSGPDGPITGVAVIG
jgi:hypothetical protein